MPELYDICMHQGCTQLTAVAAHGIKEGAVYDEYWCLYHYNKKDQDGWYESRGLKKPRKIRCDKKLVAEEL